MPDDRRIQFRVAIAMGDVVTDGDLIYGQGVDTASRLESLAEPGGINVSRAVRDQVRDRLPIAFEDLGEHEVKNVARPVRAFRIVLDKPASEAPKKAAARPERPGLVVLPFQNLSGDAEAEFFLDSVAEDLITELARARWFSVVARNTSFGYKGKGADSKQLARELGVRYVVEGSLRKAGNRVRIGCQLVEAASGATSVGRTLRRHARRFVRFAGQDHRKPDRLGRPGAAQRRSRARAAQAGGEPGRL